MIGFFALLAIADIVYNIGKAVFRAKPQRPFDLLQVPTVDAGTPIPVVYGFADISPAIVWWGDYHKDVASDNSYTSYYARMHALLCWGPLDELIDISWDGRGLFNAPVRGFFSPSAVQPYATPTKAMAPDLPIQRSGADHTFSYIFSLDLFGGKNGEGGVCGPLDLFWGTDGHPYSRLLQDKYGTDGHGASKYKNWAFCTFGVADSVVMDDTVAYHNTLKVFHFTNNTPYPKPMKFLVRKTPRASVFGQTDDQARMQHRGANPVEILYDLYTNADYALGNADSALDTAGTWAACLAQLRDEGFGLCVSFQNPKEAKEAIQDINDIIDGTQRLNPRTGKLEFKLLRGDYDVDTLDVFDASNSHDFQYSKGQWDETINEIKLTFQELQMFDQSDRPLRYYNGTTWQYWDSSIPDWVNVADVPHLLVGRKFITGTVVAQNLANRQAVGQVRTTTVDMPYISSPDVAEFVAQRLLRAASVPLAKGSFTTGRMAFDKMQGDVIKVSRPEYGLQSLVVRITGIDWGSLTDREIRVDWVEDVFGLGEASFVAPPPSLWGNPVSAPVDTDKALIEMPWAMTPSLDGSRRGVLLLARAQPTYDGFNVWVSENSGSYFSSIAPAYGFSVAGILLSDLAWTDENLETGFLISDAGGLALLPLMGTDSGGLDRGDFMACIGDEIMTFQSLTNNGDGTWTVGGVRRGAWDTVPPATSHAAGSLFYFFQPSRWQEVRSSAWVTDLDVSVKPLTFNSQGTLDIGSVTAASMTTTSRASAPYPPGRIRIGSSSLINWPSVVTGDQTLSWKFRNRFEQGTGTMAQGDSTDQTLEGTVTVDVYIGGVWARSFAAVTANSVTYTALERLTDGTDGTKQTYFEITPVGSAAIGTRRMTPAFDMAGYGMTYGEYYGGA